MSKPDQLGFNIDPPDGETRYYVGELWADLNHPHGGFLYVNHGRSAASVRRKTIKTLENLIKKLKQEEADNALRQK